MDRIKKSFSVATTTYTNWFFSSRMLIFGFVFMFVYVYYIQPLMDISRTLNTPLNALEPFCAVVNNSYSVPLLVIGYIVLIADFPRLDDFSTFMLYRTGKLPWVSGQIMFLFFSALTYLLFILLSTMIFVASESFIINAWSLVSKALVSTDGEAFLLKYPFVNLDRSVIMQARPFEATIHGICLIMLFMVSSGLIQMIFSLIRKKVISVFLNLVICGLGLIFLLLDVKVKWLFPISNGVFGWHYDGIYNKTIFPITGSYIYFCVVITFLILLVILVAKRCSFHITGGTE